MEYISIKEASVLWKIDPSNLGKLCRKGKIEGAKIVGRNWLIPKNTPKPMDGRTRKAKEGQSTPVFRFPLYVNFSEESFVPPLSPEEVKLRRAQADFYVCEFQKAKEAFETLSENAENIYVKICAMFYMCVLSAVYDVNINWDKYYLGMSLLLSSDFPHKKEMELFPAWLDFITGRFGSIPEKLNTDSTYDYHPSAWCMNIFLSAFNSDIQNKEIINLKCTEPYGTLSRIMERDGYWVEAQEMHMVIFFYYYSANNKEAMIYHLKKAVELAFEHNLIFALADADNYYADAMNAVLCEYPKSFTDCIHRNGKILYDNFSRFAEKTSKTSVYRRLSKSDYRYIFYALQGYTNRQIAEICGISERTVAKKYNDIYDKTGVFSKLELVNEMNSAFGMKK